MARILRWTAAESDAGKKLEDFLREHGCSHHVLTHLKRTERGICLNGEWAYATQRIKEGDLTEITIDEEESSEHIVPSPLPLHIVYEDEDLMVVDKPSNMPIHPSINNYENTLANAVMYYFSQQNIPFVYRCINRLDRDTSGLLIIAKHMMSGAILSQMSADRQIHREYLTIVEGILPESGTIDAPIARIEDSVLMRCVDFERGERAVTHFQRLSCFAPVPPRNTSEKQSILTAGTAPVSDQNTTRKLSLALVKLETGRTHQIRVHMKYIGHPMIGDFLYYPDSQHLIGRQALHSHKLTFVHPITKKELSFVSELPDDMRAVMHTAI